MTRMAKTGRIDGARALWLARLLAIGGVAALSLASGGAARAAALRFQVNQNGDFVLIGNQDANWHATASTTECPLEALLPVNALLWMP